VRVWTISVLLEVACQTVSQHMMLLSPFFRYKGLKGLSEECLVSARAGSNEIKKKIGSRHYLTYWPGNCCPSGTPLTQTHILNSKNLNPYKGPIYPPAWPLFSIHSGSSSISPDSITAERKRQVQNELRITNQGSEDKKCPVPVFLCAIDLFYTLHKFQPLEKTENLKIEIHKRRPSLTGLSRFTTG
jgi:hypothetical protein